MQGFFNEFAIDLVTAAASRRSFALAIMWSGSPGRIAHVNLTLLAWSGHAWSGDAESLADYLVCRPGRIYYETHIAPLLRTVRVQGDIPTRCVVDHVLEVWTGGAHETKARIAAMT
nr:hypothetical protein [Bradyrhizobium yuanmingense]